MSPASRHRARRGLLGSFLLLASTLGAAEQVPAGPAEEVLRPPEPGHFAPLFQPFRTDRAALSPDGRYLAYSQRDGDTVSVAVLEIDHPEKLTAFVRVINDEAATPMLAQDQAEKTTGRINWMRWVNASRLAVETNQVFPRKDKPGSPVWRNWRGTALAFDADGTNAKPLVIPDDVYEATNAVDPRQPATRPRNLHITGLDLQRPNAFLVAATGSGYSGLFSVDVTTGKVITIRDELLISNQTALADGQGRFRLTLPNTLIRDFPFVYDYLGAKGANRPHPLNGNRGLTGFSVSPDNFFGTRSIPLGFAEDPNVLYYASNVGRDTYGIYSRNLATGQPGAPAFENPGYDLIAPPAAAFPDQTILVFDRYQHDLAGIRYDQALRTAMWTREKWNDIQQELEAMFPGRSVDILEWDQAGRRFLVATQGPADPGAFYIYDRDRAKLMKFVQRAPGLGTDRAQATRSFSCVAANGTRLSGLLTLPRQPRLKPIPLVVLCPAQPWQRVDPDFQPEVQALAEMGFAVAQLNGRGVWGLGLKQRQALTAGYDLVQAEDIVTMIPVLEKDYGINSKRVAVMGRGHGAFIALRALQEHPEKFRCAVALDAPVDLADWLGQSEWSRQEIQPTLMRAWYGDVARLKANPLAGHPEAIVKPILMLNYTGPDTTARQPQYAAALHFAAKVRSHGTTAEFGDLSSDYMNGLPLARAAVFDRIEEFLNLNVYDFNVKLDELKIVK